MHDWNILHPAELQEEFARKNLDVRTRLNELEVLLLEESRQIRELKKTVARLLRKLDELNKS